MAQFLIGLPLLADISAFGSLSFHDKYLRGCFPAATVEDQDFMDRGSLSRESKERCAGSGTFRSDLRRRFLNAKDDPVDIKRAHSAQQQGERGTETTRLETRHMRSACL